VAACGGDDRKDPPYRPARSSLPGRALATRSQFRAQMKPAVPACGTAVVPGAGAAPATPGRY
jgi:hypothetical protein